MESGTGVLGGGGGGRACVLHGQQPALHITLSGSLHLNHSFSHTYFHSWRGHSSFAIHVDTTRGAANTGYKSSLHWRRARSQGLLLTAGEILGSHWTAIAYLKLGSPQPVRCCPATVCHPHLVHGDKGPPEKQTATMAPDNYKQNHQKRSVLKLGTWNNRMMMTGLSANLQDIKDSRKTVAINDKVRSLNVDIATLQKTRLADSGTLKEKDCMFFWQGKGSDEPREHGVGFAVRNSLLRVVEPGGGGSERLLTLRLIFTIGPVILISVYAPTLSATSDTKACSTRTLHPSSGTSPARNMLFFWATSMPEWAQIMTRDLPALVSSGWANWRKADSDTGAVHLSWPKHYELLLQHQASTQDFLETPTIKALAPTGFDPGQACCYQECSSHTLLPQCGLRYRPLLGVL